LGRLSWALVDSVSVGILSAPREKHLFVTQSVEMSGSEQVLNPNSNSITTAATTAISS